MDNNSIDDKNTISANNNDKYSIIAGIYVNSRIIMYYILKQCLHTWSAGVVQNTFQPTPFTITSTT